MDHYVIWVDLAPGASDLEFVNSVKSFVGSLQAQGKLADFRIVRRKFGFGPEGLGEFCITLSFESLAQLDAAFDVAAAREDPVEELHHAVYSRVRNFKSALYRDFPDPVRVV